MGWLSSLAGGVKAVGGIVSHVPGIGLATKIGGMIPGVGTVIGAVGAAATVYQVGKGLFGQSATSAPGAMPDMPGGLPALPEHGSIYTATHGVGGGLQMPGFGPSIPKGLMGGDVLDDSYLKQCIRAPRGYSVVIDPSGKPFAMRHSLAVRMKMRNPSGHVVKHQKKPPISVGQWHALQKSHHVIKQLRKVEKMARKVASYAGHGHHKGGGKSKKGK